MRISDWSSDVCSSDLLDRALTQRLHQRVDGFGVVVVGTDVVDAGPDEGADTGGGDDAENHDGDDESFHGLSSEPDAQAGDPLPVEDCLVIGARAIGRGAEAACPDYAQIRRELTPAPVAQAPAPLRIRETSVIGRAHV